MTLAERHALIDRAIHNAERTYPCASSATLFEVAIAWLARDYGLVVAPEEIVKVLSRLAEATPT